MNLGLCVFLSILKDFFFLISLLVIQGSFPVITVSDTEYFDHF